MVPLSVEVVEAAVFLLLLLAVVEEEAAGLAEYYCCCFRNNLELDGNFCCLVGVNLELVVVVAEEEEGQLQCLTVLAMLPLEQLPR